jgi:hypothetical protein
VDYATNWTNIEDCVQDFKEGNAAGRDECDPDPTWTYYTPSYNGRCECKEVLFVTNWTSIEDCVEDLECTPDARDI